MSLVVYRLIFLSLMTVLLTSCLSRLPKAELVSYASAYSETHKVTNDILNIVIPYERIVIRYAAENRTTVTSKPNADPNCDPELHANGCPPIKKTKTRTVVIENACLNGYRGPDQFCYEFRDGYADIGDPPLVGVYRNLAEVVARFNTIVAAYADGVSMKFIQQDLNALSSAVSQITSNPYFVGVGAAKGSLALFVRNLIPVSNLALGVRDRGQLKTFLVENYPLVDTALEQMSVNAPTLYANVAIGTQLVRLKGKGDTRNLNGRRKAIRKIIANWTVVLEDTQRLLAALKFAVENPNNLEVRLRNLDEPSVVVRSNIEVIKKQIAELSGPPELL